MTEVKEQDIAELRELARDKDIAGIKQYIDENELDTEALAEELEDTDFSKYSGENLSKAYDFLEENNIDPADVPNELYLHYLETGEINEAYIPDEVKYDYANNLLMFVLNDFLDYMLNIFSDIWYVISYVTVNSGLQILMLILSIIMVVLVVNKNKR